MPKGSRLSADTVAKMVEILQQVQPDRDMELWYWVGLRILDISVDKMKKITSTCTTDVQRLQVMVTFWLINCSYASWRLLIWSLEVADRSEIANTIHGLAEPLEDSKFNMETLVSILRTVSVDTLEDCLYIPNCRWEEIKQRCETEKERKREIVQWFVQYSALADFSDLACILLVWEETSALEEVKKYVWRVPEPSLTLSNVSNVFQHVDDYLWRYGGLAKGLTIPDSKKEEIENGYSSLSERKTALLRYFIEDHPCPSWRLVANAAYMETEYRSLEIIRTTYLQGLNLQELCIQVIASSLNCTDDVDSLPLPVALKTSVRTQLFVNTVQHHFN